MLLKMYFGKLGALSVQINSNLDVADAFRIPEGSHCRLTLSATSDATARVGPQRCRRRLDPRPTGGVPLSLQNGPSAE